MATNDDRPATSSGPILVAIGVGATIGFGWVAKDWLTAGCVLLILVMSVRGFRKGGAAIAAGLLAISAGLRFAQPAAVAAAPLLQELVSIPDTYYPWAHLAMAGMVIAVCVYVCVRFIARMALKSVPRWKPLDRWGGAMLGGLQGAFYVGLILFFALVIEPLVDRLPRPAESRSGTASARIADHFVRFVDHARRSTLGPLMTAMSPFAQQTHEHAQQMALELTNQAGRNPAMQTGLFNLADRLRDDPVALRDFSSRFGFDESTVRTILGSTEFERMVRQGVPADQTAPR